MTSYMIKGINDDTDTCACCGKTGLKRVMWLAEVVNGEEIGEPQPYGSVCAGRKLAMRDGQSKAKIDRAIEQRFVAERAERVGAAVWSIFNSPDWRRAVLIEGGRFGAVIAHEQVGGFFVPWHMWLDMTRHGKYANVTELLAAISIAYPLVGAYRDGDMQRAASILDAAK